MQTVVAPSPPLHSDYVESGCPFALNSHHSLPLHSDSTCTPGCPFPLNSCHLCSYSLRQERLSIARFVMTDVEPLWMVWRVHLHQQSALPCYVFFFSKPVFPKQQTGCSTSCKRPRSGYLRQSGRQRRIIITLSFIVLNSQGWAAAHFVFIKTANYKRNSYKGLQLQQTTRACSLELISRLIS